MCLLFTNHMTFDRHWACQHGLFGDCLSDVVCSLQHGWQDALLLTCLVGLHGWSGERGSWGNHPEVCYA